MKLFLLASSPLRPYFERLLPDCPHEVDTFYLPLLQSDDSAQLQQLIDAAQGYDAVLLPDGMAMLSEEGVTAGSCPLVVARVHNCISLLLGSPDSYRGLFAHFNGELCWATPVHEQPLSFIPKSDCACLCYLADTQLMLPDGSLSARKLAQANSWDYFQTESDLSLLSSMLSGDWDRSDILVAQTGQQICPTYDHDILA